LAQLFLSDATDSKLIIARDYLEIESEEIFLRLRLHALMLILFQRKLLISEGWALDSMAFIRVAAEIIRGIEDVKSEGVRSEELARFNPIIMEKRRTGDFRAIFQAYADRTDVRWSGFMPYPNGDSFRLEISRGLRDAAENNMTMPDAVSRVFRRLISNQYITDDMAEVARYFSDAPAQNEIRLLQVKPPVDGFQQSFNAFLRRAARGLGEPDADTALTNAAQFALDQGMSFRTSSLAMQFADRQDDPSVQDALMKAINFTYMKVSSDAANSGMTTPAHETGTLSEEIDRALVDCLHNNRVGYDLFFVKGYNKDHEWSKRIEALQNENWRLIWKNTIRMSISKEWKQAIFDFSRKISEIGYKNAALSKQYQNLETMLNANVPELVLSYSPFHRIFGYRGSETLRRSLPIAKAAAAGAAIAYLISTKFLPSSVAATTFAAGGLKFAETLIKDNYPDSLNVFSDRGIGAKRSSLLDPKLRN
jgi:hypothetical protein